MLLYGFFCYRVLMAGGLAATKVERPRSGLIADLPRAVPAPLESVVKRLASIPAARGLYGG